VLRKEAVDVSKIINESVEDLLPLAKAKNLQIMVNKKGEIKEIIADSARIRVVIENLLSNSVKYTRTRGRIEVELFNSDGFVVFSIKDDGVGIPAEQQKQVFSKFFRSDNAVRYQTDGTGLGLYIAKNIVEQSGGKIWFQSKEDTGTVFNFSLPMA